MFIFLIYIYRYIQSYAQTRGKTTDDRFLRDRNTPSLRSIEKDQTHSAEKKLGLGEDEFENDKRICRKQQLIHTEASLTLEFTPS